MFWDSDNLLIKIFFKCKLKSSIVMSIGQNTNAAIIQVIIFFG